MHIARKILIVTFALVPVALTAGAADKPASAAEPGSPWKLSADLSAKEGFDSNVYLQSVTPDADQDSFITTVIPALGVSFSASPAFSASLAYSPEVNIFHAEPSESFTLHRTGLKLGGKINNTSWDIVNAFIAISGSDEGRTYPSLPGGISTVPAAGGPAVRDRRDAMIERGSFKLTQTMGDWFLRPVVTGYLHDFQTIQKTNAGYLNYVDRSDLNGGLDVGYNVGKGTHAVLGYRYGGQTQDQLFPAINPTYYDSTYHRVLFGLEGRPWSWVKFNLSLGPEFRHYTGNLPANFYHVNETYLYANSSVAFFPSQADTITLLARSYEQPGFGGRSAYLDSTFDLQWRHKFSHKLTVGLGGRAYNTYFLPPAQRDDWIFSGNALLSYGFAKQFSGELSYSYDNANCEAPNTQGGDYTRHYVALGLKYVFK